MSHICHAPLILYIIAFFFLQAVIGTHFFSPANVMPLLENVHGKKTAPETIATAMAMGKRLGKKTVLAGNCFGFIGNRLIESYGREAIYMLEEGLSPSGVDGPMRGFGMPMGPLQMSDLAGNDIGYNIRKELFPTKPTTGRYHGTLADKLVEAGRLGQKVKKGWYDYSAGRAPVEDPFVAALLESRRAALGLTVRALDAQEVRDRCLLPMVNEGFKCIQEGIALRESDIDIVLVFGYGFPAWRGGLMHWSRHGREGGLPKLLSDMRRLSRAHPSVAHWNPCKRLVKEVAALQEGRQSSRQSRL